MGQVLNPFSMTSYSTSVRLYSQNSKLCSQKCNISGIQTKCASNKNIAQWAFISQKPRETSKWNSFVERWSILSKYHEKPCQAPKWI